MIIDIPLSSPLLLWRRMCFFCSQEMSAATFKTHQHGRFEPETTQTSTIQASVQQRPLGGHMVNGVDQVK
jgi:hypothetical protein